MIFIEFKVTLVAENSVRYYSKRCKEIGVSMIMARKGCLIVLSGPFRVMVRNSLQQFLQKTIKNSCTLYLQMTRKPRPGEVDGRLFLQIKRRI